MKLLNAFSLQMLESFPATVKFTELSLCNNSLLGSPHLCDPNSVTWEVCSECGRAGGMPSGVVDLKALESCIGHKDTAEVLGVEMHRVNVALKKGEQFVVAQLQGGRLPEGTTELPDGFSFRFYLGEIS